MEFTGIVENYVENVDNFLKNACYGWKFYLKKS